MTFVRRLVVSGLLAATIAGCSSAPSAHDQTVASEIAQMTTLKQTYPGIVMGFDVHADTTLVVSLDLQSYIGMDDDAAEAMRRSVGAHWRAAWTGAHPGAHATLHVRFIDFIGRKVAEQSLRV